MPAFFIVLVFTIILSLLPGNTNAQTASTSSSETRVSTAPGLENILQKHYAALGDFSKMQTRRVKLRVVGMAPFEIPTTVEAKRPNLLRRDVNIQGQIQTTSFDGRQAWKIDPFLPSGKQAIDMPAGDIPALMEEAYFDGILVAAQKNGYPLRYLGQENLNGHPVHVIKVSIPGTGDSSIYLDADNFLEVKRLQKRMVMGQMMELEIITSDYRKQDGLMLAFRFDVRQKGATQGMSMLVDSVETNPAIAVSRFLRTQAN